MAVRVNGPQHASYEFEEFAKAYDFNYVTRSSLLSQSNGQAEKTVQTARRLLKESADPDMALLTYCTSFPWCGLSAAEPLMGISRFFFQLSLFSQLLFLVHNNLLLDGPVY